jgi:hypothetical protein
MTKVNKGVSTFNDIVFVGKPNTTGNEYVIQSPALNEPMIIEIFGKSYYDKVKPILKVDFRVCAPGEEQSALSCKKCPV